ncbi:acetyl-CoA carboxylase biotin carboxyl carrier protein [Aciduricibacillus chroicocephali]|uniref:Biotin carboxyl carrier protein of acetyl-CoA carboxylase n=1 Tax=Aciduricibacillus chroicocephali TaxID=3054939 RepID=A0ABY9KS54_9BACI|nr:acetyl-CoA carboxylase biotin carboxyl carrier protein [Bacillaceae bacterium 44XB]
MLKIEEIQEIIKLIDKSSINEFIYETNGTSVTVKKSADEYTIQQPAAVTAPPVIQQIEKPAEPVVQEQAPQIAAAEPATSTKKTVDYDYEIVSPMVGTLYHASSPDSDPFVQIGTKVSSNTTVCIVEAMKLFNEIEAEVDGEIVEILAEDGELVEFGQPLFRVKK